MYLLLRLCNSKRGGLNYEMLHGYNLDIQSQFKALEDIIMSNETINIAVFYDVIVSSEYLKSLDYMGTCVIIFLLISQIGFILRC
jgi:hypothetical protein